MNIFSKSFVPIFIAVFLALVQILYLAEIFQWAITLLFGTESSQFSFNFIKLGYYFEPGPSSAFYSLILMYLAPIVYLIICSETASFFLKKTPLGSYRYFIIIFTLIILGYLLIHIFYNAVLVILNPGISNEWISLTIYLGFDQVERIIFSFGVIFLFVFYLNMLIRRVTNYIN